MALNSRQLNLLRYLEQEWHLNHALPTASVAAEFLSETEVWVTQQLNSADFNVAMENHGLPTPDPDLPKGLLNAKQLALINALMDPNDNRSDKKKCADLEINTAQFAAWRKDPIFLEYLHKRAQNLFGEHMDDAHRALLDNVRSGDLGSIKLMYEITGYYVPNKDAALDVGLFLMRVTEIIQKYVKDPTILEMIGSDLILLASPVPTSVGVPQRVPMVVNGSVHPELTGL